LYGLNKFIKIMSDESKKSLWMMLAGVGALVGAALLYHYATADEENSVNTEEEIKKALEEEKIGEPVRQPSGLLENRYFLNLLQFIGV
jgi:hypothetical protein